MLVCGEVPSGISSFCFRLSKIPQYLSIIKKTSIILNNLIIHSMSKKTKETAADVNPEVNVEGVENLSEETINAIKEKIKEIKATKHIKRVFAIVVDGDEEDEKPLFVGYFQNPNIMHFSAYMSFVTKDAVQAALTLARSTFIEGDRELIDDDDVFLRGTFDRFSAIMERRNSELVKA